LIAVLDRAGVTVAVVAIMPGITLRRQKKVRPP
jgi:hypothetical protein